MRKIIPLVSLLVLALAGPALADTAGGSSSSSGENKSRVRIKTSGPAVVGYNSGGVAEGSSAGSSSSAGEESGGDSHAGHGDAGPVSGATVDEEGHADLQSTLVEGTDEHADDAEPAGAHAEGTPAGPDTLTFVMGAILVLLFGFLWTRLPKGASA